MLNLNMVFHQQQHQIVKVMDEGMTQQVIDGLSEDIVDTKWTDIQTILLKQRLEQLEQLRKQRLEQLQQLRERDEQLQERDEQLRAAQQKIKILEVDVKDKHTDGKSFIRYDFGVSAFFRMLSLIAL